MKRVLQVLGSLQRGGAETMVMNVYRQIDKNKLQFDFLVKEKVSNGYEEEVKQLGGRVLYVESPKNIGVISYINRIRKIIKENGPYCAVHSHMNIMSGLIMLGSLLAGVKKRISHSHSTSFPNSKGVKVIGKILIHLFCNKRIACGELAGKALFGCSDYKVIHNGIDIDKFLLESIIEKRALREKLHMNNNKVQLCHIGRFADVKNHVFIIKLAFGLKSKGIPFELHLLGDGELLNDIKRQANELDLQEVIFHGSVNNANEYIKACDVFILPSKYEGLPVTLVEAQSAGIHCLISNNITKEVDFKLGLITYLSLDVDDWVREIKKFGRTEKIIDPDKIKEKVISIGYDIKSSSKMMTDLYL